jgi:hypothetical protein
MGFAPISKAYVPLLYLSYPPNHEKDVPRRYELAKEV